MSSKVSISSPDAVLLQHAQVHTYVLVALLNKEQKILSDSYFVVVMLEEIDYDPDIRGDVTLGSYRVTVLGCRGFFAVRSPSLLSYIEVVLPICRELLH